MNTRAFLEAIKPLATRRPLLSLMRRGFHRFKLPVPGDPCPDVLGMASPKKLKLLNAAVRFLPQDGSECYLEVGTFQGKSLIGALLGNPQRLAVACDNFTLFDNPAAPQNKITVERNLTRYGLTGQVRLYDCDFQALLATWHAKSLPRVGVYFYDGAHDEESQYLGIRLIEGLLADPAIVLVDDWRHAPDSNSYAEMGTRRAIAESANRWRLEHVFTARHNGDVGEWWNGVGLLTFEAKHPAAAP